MCVGVWWDAARGVRAPRHAPFSAALALMTLRALTKKVRSVISEFLVDRPNFSVSTRIKLSRWPFTSSLISTAAVSALAYPAPFGHW